MSAATATDDPLLDSYQTEWRILREHSHNVLLEGPVAATDAVLLLLQPHIRKPIVWSRPQAPLELPSGEASALVLRDAATVSGDDQRRLLGWLGGRGSRTQIISMTERPLFSLVAGGFFDATLYYRLNVMLLHVGSQNSTRTTSPS
jgi:hypothetical protein